MSTTIDDPDELHTLASFAMEHAFRCIQPRGPLVSFAFTQDETGTRLVRSVADRLEDMIALNRDSLLDGPAPARAVLVWDGYSNHTGQRMDTIFIDAYERGAKGGILVVQPYQVVGLVKKRVEPVGGGVVIERGRPPLF